MYRKAILKILSKSDEKWWSYSANENVNRRQTTTDGQQTDDIMITIPLLPRGKNRFRPLLFVKPQIVRKASTLVGLIVFLGEGGAKLSFSG